MKAEQINKRLLVTVVIENVLIMLAFIAGYFYLAYRNGTIYVEPMIVTIGKLLTMLVILVFMFASPIGLVYFVITAVETWQKARDK